MQLSSADVMQTMRATLWAQAVADDEGSTGVQIPW
jgi:hypothetical protein